MIPARIAAKLFSFRPPIGNEKDLVDVPEEAREKIKFVPVETVDEVLSVALETKETTLSPSLPYK